MPFKKGQSGNAKGSKSEKLRQDWASHGVKAVIRDIGLIEYFAKLEKDHPKEFARMVEKHLAEHIKVDATVKGEFKVGWIS